MHKSHTVQYLFFASTRKNSAASAMSPFVAILGTHPINKQGITAGMNISWGMVARTAKFFTVVCNIYWALSMELASCNSSGT